MKRFRFPLRPVAVLRAHSELRAREIFAAAVHAYVAAEESLASTRVRVADFESVLFAGRSGTFNASAEAQSLAAYARECALEAESERAVISARDLMQQRRAEYIEAHRRLEVVKRLEEKARVNHRLAGNREEQAEFDDLSGRRAGRRGTHAQP